MNTQQEKLETLTDEQERLVTELRKQLKAETERLNRYRIALNVLWEIDSSHYGPDTRPGVLVKLPR